MLALFTAIPLRPRHRKRYRRRRAIAVAAVAFSFYFGAAIHHAIGRAVKEVRIFRRMHA